MCGMQLNAIRWGYTFTSGSFRLNIWRTCVSSSLMPFCPGAGNGLIGGDHHAADARDVVQGLQGHDHLDGGAFGLAMMPLCPSSASGFTSGTTSGQRSSHAPRAGVVHDDAARGGGVGGVLFGGGAARGEDGDVDAFEHIFLQFAHDQLGIPVGDFVPAERAEAKGTTSVAGKFRLSRVFSISRPTAPVAPTTATTSFFSDMVSSILEQKRKASEHVIFARRSTFI